MVKQILFSAVFALLVLGCSGSDNDSSSSSALNGLWVTDCQQIDQDLYSLETVTIENEQGVKLERAEYSDAECLNLLQVSEIQFVVIPNGIAKNGNVYSVDMLYNYMILTPKNFLAVDTLNNASFCGRNDWALNQTKDLDQLDCEASLGFALPAFQTELYNNFQIANNQLTPARTTTPFGALTPEERSTDFEAMPVYTKTDQSSALTLDGVWQTDCIEDPGFSANYTWDFSSANPTFTIRLSVGTDDCSTDDVINTFNFSSTTQNGLVSGYPFARNIELLYQNAQLTGLTSIGSDFLNNFQTVGVCSSHTFQAGVPFEINGQDCTTLYDYIFQAETTFYSIVQVSDDRLFLGRTDETPFGSESSENRPINLSTSIFATYFLVPNP